MLSTRQLVTFLWSAKLGSFTAAAKRMHTTQSVVSMRVRELERALGVELFDRRGRAAVLTIKGRILLGYAEELVRLSSEARESIAGEPDAPQILRLGVAEVVSITWLPRLIGKNWWFCLTVIPSLSIVPLTAFFWALRRAAPADPGLAGALAGLSAGAIAATPYASHCTDDSPLFVITWYSLAIGLVTLVGYFAGRRWLAW